MSASCARPENCRSSPLRRFDTIIHLLRVIPHESPPPLLISFCYIFLSSSQKCLISAHVRAVVSSGHNQQGSALCDNLFTSSARRSANSGPFFFLKGGCPDYTLFTGARKHSDNLAPFKHLKTLSLFLRVAEKDVKV